MESLCGYESEGDSPVEPSIPEVSNSYIALNSTNSVNIAPKSNFHQLIIKSNSNPGENAPIQSLLAPVLGPLHPYKQPGTGKSLGNFGSIEKTSIEEWSFNQQYQSYQTHGFAIDSSTNSIIGDTNSFQSASSISETERKKRFRQQKQSEPKSIGSSRTLASTQPKNEMIGFDEDDEEEEEEEENEDESEGNGPWAKLPNQTLSVSRTDILTKEKEKEGQKKAKSEVEEEQGSEAEVGLGEVREGFGRLFIHEPDEEDEKWQKVTERKIGYALPPRPPRGSLPPPAVSTFHRAHLTDYQGRGWSAAPSGTRAKDAEAYLEEGERTPCYVPKKCIKTFSGHSKGVHAIEFFPCTGHLLFSASMDGRAKVWDVGMTSSSSAESLDGGGGAGCLRTYVGHSEAIRSLCVAGDGKSFLTSSFDRYIRLWDTETGQPLSTFTNRQMHYQVLFPPSPSSAELGSPSPPLFLSAGSDNKIHQWDLRTGNVELVYNYHLQPVNALCFFDEGRKFISTSDDKKVLVWELDTPVPIKYIQDAELHAVPALAPHPSGQWICGQSMDNSIVTFASGEKLRPMRKKTFRGLSNAGYSPQLGFSPNGQFLISGDGSGKLVVWDWKSMKLYRKLQAHSGGPCVGARWHPHPSRNSWVATCGWDGLIKIWD